MSSSANQRRGGGLHGKEGVVIRINQCTYPTVLTLVYLISLRMIHLFVEGLTVKKI